jgi:hypothetical protein
VASDAVNAMFYRVTADTTFKVFNVNGVTSTTVDGDGVFISADDSTAGKAGYLVCRVNYLRPRRSCWLGEHQRVHRLRLSGGRRRHLIVNLGCNERTFRGPFFVSGHLGFILIS